MKTNGNGTHGTLVTELSRLFHLADGRILALPLTATYTVLAVPIGEEPTTAPNAANPVGGRLTAAQIAHRKALVESVGVPAAAKRLGVSAEALYRGVRIHGWNARKWRTRKAVVA